MTSAHSPHDGGAANAEELVRRYADDRGAQLSDEDLRALWFDMFPSNYWTRQGCNAFLAATRSALGHQTPDELEFRPGGWTVDASRGIVQTAIAAGLLSGVLVVAGVAGLPAAVLPAVLPLLFDVKRCTLTAGEQMLLAKLVMRDEVRGRALPPDQLYQQVPADVRAHMSRVAFEDFLEACLRAGHADGDLASRVELRAEAGFRVTIV